MLSLGFGMAGHTVTTPTQSFSSDFRDEIVLRLEVRGDSE